MNKKAIGLVSGGLDSILSLKLIQEQNIEVIGLFIKTPFLINFGEKTVSNLNKLSNEMNFELIIREVDEDYIDIVRNPKFGYGKNLNPCIDCHIYMLKIAKKVMAEKNALFVFTGEVLGQRGKSQNINALRIIEEKSTLKGILLRPLSAQLLEPTEIEKKGIIKRELLLGLKGRERKIQLYLANMKNLKYFGTPSGGCLLTDPTFCRKVRDLFKHSERITLKDCYILQIGRHFRISPFTKLIVTRDKVETQKILNFCHEDDFILRAHYSSEIIGIIKGKIDDLCFKIFSSYIKLPSDLIILMKTSGEIIEKRICEKEDKIKYHQFLI